jgi:hypothetical protein
MQKNFRPSIKQGGSLETQSRKLSETNPEENLFQIEAESEGSLREKNKT